MLYIEKAGHVVPVATLRKGFNAPFFIDPRADTPAIDCLAMAFINHDVMHRRLLHADSKAVQKACDQAGLSLKSKPCEDCHTCRLAKSTEIISRAHETACSAPGQLIRVDTFECKPGHLNLRYCIHYSIDSYSGYQWVQFVVKKSDAFSRLQAFVAHFERQSSLKVQAFGLNGGGEFGQNTRPFTSSKLKTFASQLGIALPPTTPHIAQSNGRAERAGRTLMDRARAAMIEANMPTELWPFAVQTATVITDLLPTRANSDFQSPHYRLFTALGLSQEASVPYIKHLRVFGCTAYVHLKGAYQANTDKFGPRAEVGRLVGYDGHHGKIFYVWFPDTGRIARVSSVRFSEGQDPLSVEEHGDILGVAEFHERPTQLTAVDPPPFSKPVPIAQDTRSSPQLPASPHIGEPSTWKSLPAHRLPTPMSPDDNFLISSDNFSFFDAQTSIPANLCRQRVPPEGYGCVWRSALV